MTLIMTNNNKIYDNNENNMQQDTEFTIEEYEQELNYFQEYDEEMLDTIEHFDDDIQEGDEIIQDQEEEEPYTMDEGLLKLIVDVQSYLADAPTDSPLFSLQYKMYTYLKQRALEMGMEIPSI